MVYCYTAFVKEGKIVGLTSGEWITKNREFNCLIINEEEYLNLRDQNISYLSYRELKSRELIN